MLITNVKVFTEEKFVPGSIIVRGDTIQKVLLDEGGPVEIGEEELLDGQGSYCLPGMIDLHFHGCKGYDFCDGTREAVDAIAKYEASIGVTAIAPATMTLPVEELEKILMNGAAYRREQLAGLTPGRADLIGVNMEGPFISKEKKGAQDAVNIIPFDVDIYRRFQKAADGLVKFIGIAPEEGDARSFIEQVKGEVSVALAHTNADYDRAKEAFDAGANHLVHMYNAMPSFTHREPGVIGAAADQNCGSGSGIKRSDNVNLSSGQSAHMPGGDGVMAEIICDGVHIHPSAVRVAFTLMGKEQMILISDSMRAAGMPDGRYTLGGLDVDVKGNRATLLSDGALAGSVTTLPDCVRTAVKKMGIPLETAVACATIHPARSLGEESRYGSIDPGKKADLVLWDEDLVLVGVIKDGKKLV